MYNRQLILSKSKLTTKYKLLIEQAYNFRQSDSALSEYFEYKAIKTLNKMNRLDYLEPFSN